ncbi:sporulation protein [Halorubellus sp. PRR65]|uniref:sporulation protein n=1 Tax=Halorubellus sp. PRR65 TaxID=3098148 RepID=UPI002B25970A|nr:sporulation protein [Halorubellus sp. PRR65]
MKRILSSVGIGSATVDTVLPRTTLRPGETVAATVDVEGGSTEQEIDRVDFAFVTRYRDDEGYESTVLGTSTLRESFTVGEGERREFSVDLEVPRSTPVTRGGPTVHLKTGLDIDWAVDPTDEDPIEVEPTERMQAVFDAADALGLSFSTSECQRAAWGTSQPFLQEFEFRARSGPYASDLDEIELVFVPGGDALTVQAEVDRRGGLLAEMAETDERRARFDLATADAEDAERKLADTIERNV